MLRELGADSLSVRNIAKRAWGPPEVVRFLKRLTNQGSHMAISTRPSPSDQAWRYHVLITNTANCWRVARTLDGLSDYKISEFQPD